MVLPEAFPCTSQAVQRRLTANPHSSASSITNFLGHDYLQPPPPPASQFRQQWSDNSRSSANESEEDDAEVENLDEDVDEGEERNLENITSLSKINGSDQNFRYGVVANCGDMKYGVSPGRKGEDSTHNVTESVHSDNRSGENRIIRDSEAYYSGCLKTGDGPSSSGQKDDTTVQDSCRFSGRKDGVYPSGSGQTLRASLSDPLTGTLMEDAMILPCGHSYGSGGIQQILCMKVCYTCSQPVSEASIYPNLSLRLAVQAFNREEGFHTSTLKRRRERYVQEKAATDRQKGKRIQFPFAVTDRVIIKGNKRTPERFFGREAVITAECLNGWYVVKTLDNAESVKLQYRSLAKLSDKPSPTINWLTAL